MKMLRKWLVAKMLGLVRQRSFSSYFMQEKSEEELQLLYPEFEISGQNEVVQAHES